MERRDSPGFWGLIPPRTRKTKEVPRRSASGRKPQVNKGSVLLKSSNRWKQVRCGPQPQTLNHPDAPFQCSLKHGNPKISQTFDRMGQSENQMRLEKC